MLESKWDVLTPLLALWVFLWVLSEFFSLWVDARFDRLTFYGLLALVSVPTLTSLAAFAVLPDDVPAEGWTCNASTSTILGCSLSSSP